MDEIANGVDKWPASREMPELPPRPFFQFAVNFAVSTWEQKLESVVWQLMDRVVVYAPGLWVRFSAVLDNCRIAKCQPTSGNEGSPTAISIDIVELRARNRRIDFKALVNPDVRPD